MKAYILLGLIFLFPMFILIGCANPQGDSADPTPGTTPSPGTSPTNPPGGALPGGNTYVPVNDPSEYPNITGGTFKVSRVAVHSNNWSATFSGIVADGSNIYELWGNPSGATTNIYRVVKTSETGTSSTYCTWYGDGNNYRGISFDAGKLFFRKYSNTLSVQKYDPTICLAEASLSLATQTDSAGFSLSTYSEVIHVLSGKIYVPFYFSSVHKLRLLDPSLLKYSDFALEQSLGGERARYDTSLIAQENLLWSVTPCKLVYNTLCLWKIDSSAGKLTYAYLPKGSFPDMVPPDFYTKIFILKGAISTELRFVVVKGQEVRIYVLDVSKF